MTDLTREQILAMEAGPELNALVAKEVMGWKSEGKYWWCPANRVRRLKQYWQASEDIADAWEVFHEIRGRVFSGRITFMAHAQKLISKGCVHGDMMGWPDAFWFITPEIICKAALLATLEWV